MRIFIIKTTENFKLKKYEEFEKNIQNEKIKLGDVRNYNGKFLYVKYQPYVRLTLIVFKEYFPIPIITCLIQ